jgi:hypothetical protein
MMQIGWAVLLVLVAQFSNKDETPALSVPGVKALKDIPLSAVYLPGAFLVLLWWSFTSRSYRLVKLFALRFLRSPVSIMLWGSWVLLVLTYGLAADAIEERRFNAWKKRQDPKWIAEWEPKLKQSGLKNEYEKQTKWNLNKPYELIGNWVVQVLTNIESAATIALAPFYSYSFEEEQKSTKAPMQIFASAIARLRLALGGVPPMQYVHFITMPDVMRIESDDQARSAVHRYKLDTLLWGSYISPEPPRIWLNIQNRTKAHEEKRDFEKPDDMHPLSTRPVIDVMMVVDQNDAVDAYIVILLSYLRTLESRKL